MLYSKSLDYVAWVGWMESSMLDLTFPGTSRLKKVIMRSPTALR